MSGGKVILVAIVLRGVCIAATKGQTAFTLLKNISLRVGTYQASADRCPRNQVICLGTPLTRWRGHFAEHFDCLLALLCQKWIWRALVCLDSKGFCGCSVLQETEEAVLAPSDWQDSLCMLHEQGHENRHATAVY